MPRSSMSTYTPTPFSRSALSWLQWTSKSDIPTSLYHLSRLPTVPTTHKNVRGSFHGPVTLAHTPTLRVHYTHTVPKVPRLPVLHNPAHLVPTLPRRVDPFPVPTVVSWLRLRWDTGWRRELPGVSVVGPQEDRVRVIDGLGLRPCTPVCREPPSPGASFQRARVPPGFHTPSLRSGSSAAPST